MSSTTVPPAKKDEKKSALLKDEKKPLPGVAASMGSDASEKFLPLDHSYFLDLSPFIINDTQVSVLLGLCCILV